MATTDTATRPSTAKPGAFVEIFVGLIWLGTSAWTAHATYNNTGPGLSAGVEDAVGALPSTVAATIFTSAAIASAVAGRFPLMLSRLLAGLGTGVAFGVLAALGIRFGYGTAPAVTVLALVVAAAGVLGGAAAALPGPVIEAALWGTTWVLFFGLIFGVLTPQMVNLLGGGPTATVAAQDAAEGRAGLLQSLAIGIIGTLQATSVLRRERPAWGWCPIACALPAVVLLAAEGLSRLGGSKLTDLLPGGTSPLNATDDARLRHGLIVLAVGVVLGSLLARRKQPDFD